MREERPGETMLRRLAEIEERMDRQNEELKKARDKIAELLEILRDDEEEQK